MSFYSSFPLRGAQLTSTMDRPLISVEKEKQAHNELFLPGKT
jgi:hypothetical protein